MEEDPDGPSSPCRDDAWIISGSGLGLQVRGGPGGLIPFGLPAFAGFARRTRLARLPAPALRALPLPRTPVPASAPRAAISSSPASAAPVLLSLLVPLAL